MESMVNKMPMPPSKEKRMDWIRIWGQSKAEEKQEKFDWKVVVEFLNKRGYKNFKFFESSDDALNYWIRIKGDLKGADNGAVVISWRGNYKKLSEPVIDELAKHINLLSGKWLIYVKRENIDEVWKKIKNLKKKIWDAKVSTAKSPEKSHVICVNTKNYLDEGDVMRTLKILRGIGIKDKISYKPDIYTMLDIYSDTKDLFGLSKVSKYIS